MKTIIYTISLVVALLIGTSIGYFVLPTKSLSILPTKQNPLEPDPKVIEEVDKPNLKSSIKAFPIEKDDKLYLYYPREMRFEETQYRTVSGSGAMDIGETDPLASPNFYYSAFINSENKTVNVISHETKSVFEVPVNCEVDYITTWLKDSKRVIFHCFNQTIEERKFGMIPWEGSEKFDKGTISGFVMFDIETGELTHLYPITSLTTVMDNSKILVRSTNRQDRFVTFDVDTFIANYDEISDTFEFGDTQFNVSEDGKYWAFHEGGADTETSVNMVLAEVGKETGTIIASGAWANVQWPKVSPNAQFVVYQKRVGQNPDGTEINDLILYDVNAKSEKNLGKGSRPFWAGNDGIIFYRYTMQTTNVYYYNLAEGKVYDVTTMKN
jgi:hypothetical protein